MDLRDLPEPKVHQATLAYPARLASLDRTGVLGRMVQRAQMAAKVYRVLLVPMVLREHRDPQDAKAPRGQWVRKV